MKEVSKRMNKSKFPVISTVLYILAGLLLVFSIWAIVYSANYISTMMAQGQLVFSGNEFEIVSFYMSNVAQYFVFAVILFVLGRIMLFFTYEDDELVEETLELISDEDEETLE